MIEVTVPCSCPDQVDDKGVIVKRRPIHAHDTVSMPEVTDVRIGTGVMAAMRLAPADVAQMESAISAVLVRVAPREWSFVDDKGQPLELTPENIDLRLTWNQGGMEVAEKANGLYGSGSPTGVFTPLLPRKPKASRNGRTGSSISPTPTPGSTIPSSDKPSLRTVTGGKPSAAKAS